MQFLDNFPRAKVNVCGFWTGLFRPYLRLKLRDQTELPVPVRPRNL